MPTWEEYAETTRPMNLGPFELWYQGLGLAGEAGEVVEEIKKGYRTGHAIRKGKLLLELGDVLWYWTRICEHFKWTLSDVAQAHIDKLVKRCAEGGYVG